MQAAIYTRISRDEAGDGLGVARQQDDCETLIRRRGWSLAGVYCDNDLSAYRGRPRPAYRRLLVDLREGRVDAVVSWAPERLHRSPVELEEFIQLIDTTGAVVETVKAGTWDVSTSHGRLVARMLGAVSRAESERTGERVSRAHQQAKNAGLWRGPIPFGMQPSGRAGLPEPNEHEAALVRGLFDRVLRGEALTAIARDLNERGELPRRGKAWTHTGVLRLLSSPALGGLLRINGDLVDAAFDGVVSSERWHATQAAIARRPRGEARRPRESLTLLGGILVCDVHETPLYGGGKAHGPIYGASSTGLCHTSISRAPADAFITQLVLARLKQEDARDLLVLRPAQRSDFAMQAEELRQRRDDIVTLIAEGVLAASAARQQLAALGDQIAALEIQQHHAPFDAADLLDPLVAWDGWTMPQRRTALSTLFVRLSLAHTDGRRSPRSDPSRIKVTWR